MRSQPPTVIHGRSKPRNTNSCSPHNNIATRDSIPASGALSTAAEDKASPQPAGVDGRCRSNNEAIRTPDAAIEV